MIKIIKLLKITLSTNIFKDYFKREKIYRNILFNKMFFPHANSYNSLSHLNNQTLNSINEFVKSSKQSQWSNDSFSSSSNDSLNFDDQYKHEYEIRNLYGKCRICNNDASGNHYGVVSCEPCKVEKILYK